jgi:hypothetical protein
LLHERILAEQQFDIHQVVVDANRIEILPGQIHGLSVHGEFKVGLAGGELRLLLIAVVSVGDLHRLAFDLVNLVGDRHEHIPPTIHRIVSILRRDRPGTARLLAIHVQVGGAVVVLQPGRQFFGIDHGECREGFLDTVL